MTSTGKLILFNEEPVIRIPGALFGVCKGSRLALEATGKKMGGNVRYSILPSNKAVVLGFM
jgi:hypothetical protein